MVKEQRQAEKLVLSRGDVGQSAVFQDIDSRFKQCTVCLSKIILLLEVADSDIVQADESDLFFDKVEGGCRIEIHIVLDEFFRCVCKGRITCLEEEAFAGFNIVLLELLDFNLLLVFNLDNAGRADGSVQRHICYGRAAGDEVKRGIDVGTSVGDN